jgi:hypothetical protein
MLTCKHTTRLISQGQDRPLSLRERVMLRMHLMMCSGCSNFNKQILFIRTACRKIGG